MSKYPRRIKKKEREHGMKYCTFCQPDKVEAIYRDEMCLACEEHYQHLHPGDDGRMTEADYMTWDRIV